tara:strand:+ start:2025 stop:2915 length:891 start_codon:yes stop_codon:yes gene_type:complete
MRKVEPLTENYSRVPEQGRIRLGMQHEGKGYPKSLDAFRFTSPDRDAIENIAGIYGGSAKMWNNKKATPQNQWEVFTEASELSVFLPPNSIDVWYEEWSGGGLLRRCDGIEAQVQNPTPDGIDTDIVPCVCSPMVDKGGSMLCDPHTRLNVILPDVRFGGTWRIESKGWSASRELPAMINLIYSMQESGMTVARLSLEKRKKITNGKTYNFVVPKLSVDSSPVEIMSGAAVPQIEQPEVPAITERSIVEVIEAEIVEDEKPNQYLEEGWDVPPEGIPVKRNPSNNPTAFKWIPADG